MLLSWWEESEQDGTAAPSHHLYCVGVNRAGHRSESHDESIIVWEAHRGLFVGSEMYNQATVLMANYVYAFKSSLKINMFIALSFSLRQNIQTEKKRL